MNFAVFTIYLPPLNFPLILVDGEGAAKQRTSINRFWKGGVLTPSFSSHQPVGRLRLAG
jgi:hypothetical protein